MDAITIVSDYLLWLLLRTAMSARRYQLVWYRKALVRRSHFFAALGG